MKPNRMNHLNWSRSAGIALTATLVTVCCPAAHAVDRNWDAGGGADTDFSTPANWSDDTMPVAGDNALINGTATITADVASSGSRLNILEVGRWFGSGTVTQTSGTVYTGGFNVGFIGTGVYNLNGSGSINMTNDFLLGKAGGAADSGNGTLNMNTSGTFTTNKFRIADDSWGSTAGPSGTFNLSAGTVTSTFGFVVGGDATANTGLGTLNLSGGVINSNGNFVIGDGNRAEGALVMTGGELNVTGSNGTEFWVGNSHNGDYSEVGNGSAIASSGTLNVGSWLVIGRDGGQGTFTVSGDAVVNQGTSDANATLELGNFNAGGTATLHLDGGTLHTNGIYDNGGATSTTTVNLNGGTLTARKDNGDFLNADTINVQNGGAVIDSNGYNIGIDNVLAANGTGGLTKNGEGTLTLAGANTYTGKTTVTGGSLALASGGSIANSSEIALNGGNFNVSAVPGYSTGASQALTGPGSITGDITVTGTLAIGNSPGTMTFNDDLTIGGSATSNFEFTNITFGAGTYDLAQGGEGTQNVTFGGILNLFFSGGTYADNSSVQIFNFESYDGDFDFPVNFSGLGEGQSAIFNASTGFVTVIPEPGAALLGGIGMLALLRRRRG